MADPVRLAMLGAGRWSSRMHRPALRRLCDDGVVQVVGVCDRDAAAAEAWAEGFDKPPLFSDPETMLDQSRAEGLVIVTPLDVTAEMIRLAARRQVPFLAEKPPAPDSTTHQALHDTVGNLPHIIAYNRRHAPYMTEAVEWMRDAPTHTVTCMFVRYHRWEEDFTGTAVHAIDTARFLAGGDLAEARLEAASTDHAVHFFLNGWTDRGVRVDILITPDTGSSMEHYWLRGSMRSARVAFPFPHTIDLPGGVELHETNQIAQRITAGDLGVSAEALEVLDGIVAEHARFASMLRGQAEAVSTLKTSLQTQVLREELAELLGEIRDGRSRTSRDYQKD